MKLREKHIEFEFPESSNATRHDGPLSEGDGNSIWAGVDFRISEVGRDVWIEVKDYSYHAVRHEDRRTADKKYAKDLTCDEFCEWIVAKLTGTAAYLAWNQPPFTPRKTLYIVVLDSSIKHRRPLLVAFGDRLRGTFAKTHRWVSPINSLVTDLDGYNQQFPNYPAVRV